MRKKSVYLILIITIYLLIIISTNVLASETFFGSVSRFDSYSKESLQSMIGDGFEVSIKAEGQNERILVTINNYEASSKEYFPVSNSIEYTYTGSYGEVQKITSVNRLQGTHFFSIIAQRMSDGQTLKITIYLKSTTKYELDKDSVLLKYNDEYQAYLDNIASNKKLAEEKYLETSQDIGSGDIFDPVEPEIEMPTLKAEYSIDEHVATLKIPGLKLVDSAGVQQYETRYLGSTKYLIKFDSSKGNVNLEQINTNDYMVKRISISTDKVTKKTTIVIESDAMLYFKRNTTNEKTDFEISISARPIIDYGANIQITDPGLGIDVGNADLITTNYVDNIYGTKMDSLNISYTNTFSYDEVVIDLQNSSSHRVHRMTESDRVVIDIKGIDLTTPLNTISINSRFIKAIRYAHFNNNTARVVLDLKNPAGYSSSYSPQNNYTCEEKNGKLYIKIWKRLFDKYYYSNKGDRIYLLMIGEYLTKSEFNIYNDILYTKTYNYFEGIYTLKYDSPYAFNGRMNIYDAYVEYIEVVTISGKATMKIKLADRSLKLLPITRYMKTSSGYNYWHSTITFLKPKTAGEKLIVIDPGHGGADSGAIGNGILEKDLNLDIAKRLKDLFAGSNVRVYLTRSDDSYVGLGERTAVANVLNADLFLSIHHNAYYSSFNGTETFHFTYPEANNGITADVYAGILQKHQIADLGLFDRGVKKNTFSVLKYTDMPSALVEIGFITNLNDVVKLKDPAFRHKAANALYKALKEALQKVR